MADVASVAPQKRLTHHRTPSWRAVADTVNFWAVEPLKLQVKRLLHAHELSVVQDNLAALAKAKFVLISTMRNEAFRVAYFLEHHRKLGFEHFIIVDNQSDDNLRALVRDAPDVTVFSANGSYKASRFGIVWVNHILSTYAVDKWILHVDPDEFLVYPECDREPIGELARKLEGAGMKALPTILVDMYSARPVTENACLPGQNPLEVCSYFDGDTYSESVQNPLSVKHIRGGPRARVFFGGNVAESPMLNKTPLVRWRPHYAFARSTNEIWPPYLAGNLFAKRKGMAGALLHFKFLSEFVAKIEEERERKEHCEEYSDYSNALDRAASMSFMTENSVRYEGWRSLARCALISTIMMGAPMNEVRIPAAEESPHVIYRSTNDEIV